MSGRFLEWMRNSFNMDSRNQIIVRTSIIGILCNVLLAIFKAIVGVLSHSIAIIMDAVNNLSDAMSSLITIVGTKLSEKPQDKKHPFGYGRVEYLSTTVISIIILYAGMTSLIESIKNLLSPVTPNYSNVILVIVCVAIIVKIFLGRYVKKIGESVQSDSLIASGIDAMNDSIISLSTLLAAIIYITTNISTEAYLGIIISLIILKSGFELLRDTISEILGERISPELSKKVKECINSFDEVQGTYDLVIHNYGPKYMLGSVHMGIDEDLSVVELSNLEKKIADKVAKECNVIMTGISIYSVNNKDEKINSIRNEVYEIINNYEHVKQTHGFYVDNKSKIIEVDVVVSFDAEDRYKIIEDITKDIQNKYKDYIVNITLDLDVSD